MFTDAHDKRAEEFVAELVEDSGPGGIHQGLAATRIAAELRRAQRRVERETVEVCAKFLDRRAGQYITDGWERESDAVRAAAAALRTTLAEPER